MRSCTYGFILIIIFFICNSCSNDVLEIVKVSGFVPEVQEYEYYIEGEIGGKLLRYPQQNPEWAQNINLYSYNYNNRNTPILASIDSLYFEKGRWFIEIINIELDKIDFPYTLKENECKVSWLDPRVDNIIKEKDYCTGPDVNCQFVLFSGENLITINSFENKIIEGEFNGTAILRMTGFNSDNYDELNHIITNGKFKIKFR